MTPAERLERGMHADHLRTLNGLVFAVECCEDPATPDIPNWDNSPASLECRGEETRTPEELQKIGLEWQELASKLHDLLEGVAFDDHINVLSDLRAKAKEARLALIALDAYDPPTRQGS